MFPNVRLLIAAVVASVVALSCGFALFATFRVNHEPLSRLATGAAPLQLAAGSPLPSVATARARRFVRRPFPVEPGRSSPAHRQRRRHASPNTTTASNRRALSPAPPRRLPNPTPSNRRSPPRSRRSPRPCGMRSRTTLPSRAVNRPRRANRRRLRRRLRQRSRRLSRLRPPSRPHPRNKPVKNPARTPSPAPSPIPRRRPQPSRHLRRPTLRPPTGIALPPRRNGRARRARSPNPASGRPKSAAHWCHCRTALPQGRRAPAKSVRPFNRSASLEASAARSCRRQAIEHRPVFGVRLMAARAETT